MIFESALLTIGRFRCVPGDPRWEQTNSTGPCPLVAFPGTSVTIHHAGRQAVLATRNHVMFYNPGARYRRTLHDERGDHCAFVELAPRLAAEIAGTEVVPFTHGPVEADAYVAHQTLVRRLDYGAVDPLDVEERTLEILRRSFSRAIEHHGLRCGRRRRADARHHELVEDAKSLLIRTVAEQTTLDGLARELHTSPFHLARVFRAHTAFTLHGYRNQLRLRIALERVLAGGVDLPVLAYELGFSSHSHFTNAFRAAFGAPPSSFGHGRARLR